jgi:hypothetical protein
MTYLTQRQKTTAADPALALTIVCPRCRSVVGQDCTNREGTPCKPHVMRLRYADPFTRPLDQGGQGGVVGREGIPPLPAHQALIVAGRSVECVNSPSGLHSWRDSYPLMEHRYVECVYCGAIEERLD